MFFGTVGVAVLLSVSSFVCFVGSYAVTCCWFLCNDLCVALCWMCLSVQARCCLCVQAGRAPWSLRRLPLWRWCPAPLAPPRLCPPWLRLLVLVGGGSLLLLLLLLLVRGGQLHVLAGCAWLTVQEGRRLGRLVRRLVVRWCCTRLLPHHLVPQHLLASRLLARRRPSFLSLPLSLPLPLLPGRAARPCVA